MIYNEAEIVDIMEILNKYYSFLLKFLIITVVIEKFKLAGSLRTTVDRLAQCSSAFQR